MGNDLIDGDNAQTHAYPKTVKLQNTGLTAEARQSLRENVSR